MTNLTHLYLQEVLDKNRLSILDKLLYFKNNGFILGGGTGLALIFGHRESIDFDFFISKDIDTKELFEKCLEIFSGYEVIKTYFKRQKINFQKSKNIFRKRN